MSDSFQEHSDGADSPVEAQPLWEYPCFPLGSQCKMITINLGEGSLQSELAQGEMVLSLDHAIKECNGIALWADWHMDGSDRPKSIISTGPLFPIEEVPSAGLGSPLRWNVNWRQGVHLLRKQFIAKKTISWRVKFNGQLKSCYFQFGC